jgi:hypothetical protein
MYENIHQITGKAKHETPLVSIYTLLQKNSKYAVFRSLFQRFLGIIQVARLAMCYIPKCSESFIVFNGVNSFPIEQF